jgi:hypothetical protein
MSEAEAYLRIHAARLGREFPLILRMLANGELHLTAIKLVGPHLKPDNHVRLLQRARFKRKREIEVLVAELAPKPDVPSVIRKLPEPAPARAMNPRQPQLAVEETRDRNVVDRNREPLPSPQPTLAPTMVRKPDASNREWSPQPSVTTMTTDRNADDANREGERQPSVASTDDCNREALPHSRVSASTARDPGAHDRVDFQLAAPPDRVSSITPLRPGRYKVEFTVGQAMRGKLEQMKDLLRHQVPDGALGIILERAADLWIEKTMKERYTLPTKTARRAVTASAQPAKALERRAVIASAQAAASSELRTNSANADRGQPFEPCIVTASAEPANPPKQRAVTASTPPAKPVEPSPVTSGQVGPRSQPRTASASSQAGLSSQPRTVSASSQAGPSSELRTIIANTDRAQPPEPCIVTASAQPANPPKRRSTTASTQPQASASPPHELAIIAQTEPTSTRPESCPSSQPTPSHSRYVPRSVVREVFTRDGGQCTFVSSDGRRCSARGPLELHHHETPFARGGAPTAANLRIVCRAHNALFAERDYGRGFMQSKLTEARQRKREATHELAPEREQG